MRNKMYDKYDESIEYLTINPEHIYETWNEKYNEPEGCLFKPLGEYHCNGCLTQVKSGLYDAEIEFLTEMIHNDSRVPSTGREITVESLPIFAEYQRLADRILPSRQKR